MQLPLPQSGARWSCSFEGEQGLRHCLHDHLHAMEPALGGTQLRPFVAKVLEAKVPLAKVPDWVKVYEEQPPADLVRMKPEGGLWYEVLTCQRGIDSLSDAEVLGLEYKAAGGQQILMRQTVRGCGMTCTHAAILAQRCPP